MRAAKWLGILLILALLVVPRVVALDADTLPSLCWNSGIWTDEGFYTYNARNAVLFGQAELDDFNNRMLSPVLDIVQRAVFQAFGVGLVQARAVSVVSALLALAFFYDALRRIFGRRIALTGLVLLGGEVTFILYNRLALMETPGVLVLCAALWGVALGTPAGWVLAGALAAGAIAFKTTLLVFLPIPVLVWAWRWWEERGQASAALRPLKWYVGGVVLGAGLYLALWGIPHHDEIWRMNNYYRTRQIQPKTPADAVRYAERALVGYKRGLLQFLETRTPVLATLLVAGLLMAPVGAARKRRTPRAAQRIDMMRTLWLWAGLALLALAVSRYSPSRYYLVAYPAIAGLAAVTLWRLTPLWRWARRYRGGVGLVVLLGAPFFLLVYHLLLPGTYALRRLDAGPILDRIGGNFGLTAQALAAVATALLVWRLLASLPHPPRPRRLIAGALTLFLTVSMGQWAYWYATRGYETRAAAEALERAVGKDAILAGDWAPNLCLNNDVRAVPVLPGLANWRDPVGTLDADYVLVTQSPWPVRYWKLQAPRVVRPENLVKSLEVHGYRLNLYRVPARLRGDTARRPARTRQG